MEKRTILAVVLSAAVWIAWFLIFQPDKNAVDPVKPVDQVSQDASAPAAADKSSAIKSIEQTEKSEPITVKPSGIAETEIPYKTGTFDFVFTNRGAAVKRVKEIKRGIELSVEKNPFSARGDLGFSLHFSDREFMLGNSLDGEIWKHRVDKNRVIFSAEIKIGETPLKIEKIYELKDKGHDFTVEYVIENAGREEFKLGNGKLIISPAEMLGPTLDFSNSYNTQHGIARVADSYKQMTKGGGFFSEPEILTKTAGETEWVGIMSRYFLVIMIPQNVKGEGSVFDNRGHSGFRTGMYSKIKSIAPKAKETITFRVYLGEKDKALLGAIDKNIIDAADYSSWIEPIRDFVVWVLVGINSVIGNLGWSLVIFSILSKIVFMPLTTKSTESMKRMQELNPRITALREKYKDKPDMIQKETMKLYKDNKVNPLGGCLPLLLQMPFFFALYSALINSIDLWQAPFILWMTDLSMPDTVFSMYGYNLNILPIIMTLSTFVQQKISTVDTGGQQQKIMMMMMPFIFIFIFWNMPSGLVIFWTLQNVFQIAHQLTVGKFFPKKDENKIEAKK